MFKKVLKFGGIGCGGFIVLTLVLAVIMAIAGGGEDQTPTTSSPDSQAATSNTGEQNSSANSPKPAVTPGAIATTDECPTVAEELYLSSKSDTMVPMLAGLERLGRLSNQAVNNSMMFGNPEWLSNMQSTLAGLRNAARQLRQNSYDLKSVRDLHSDMERIADLLEETAERYEDFVNFSIVQDSDEAEDAFKDVADSVEDIIKLADSAGDKVQDFCR